MSYRVTFSDKEYALLKDLVVSESTAPFYNWTEEERKLIDDMAQGFTRMDLRTDT